MKEDAAVKEDPAFALGYLGLANTAPTAADFFTAMRQAAGLAKEASTGEAHMIRAAEAGANGRFAGRDGQRQEFDHQPDPALL